MAERPGGKRHWIDRTADKFTVGDGCWEWTGARSNGYGNVEVANRKRRGAHRVIYELLVGAVPDGLELDHLCRNRGCVRPDHLEPVTASENNRRGINVLARKWASRTHCEHGHEYTPENTHIGTRGQRICRACERERQRQLRARQKGR